MNLALKTIKVDGKVIPVTDSREVALQIKKEHRNLLRDIRGYIDILEGSNLSSQKFFIKDTYINSQNKEQPCYQLTKEGCEMVANKMTGKKGVLFTATYVDAFNKMQEQLKVGQTKSISSDIKQKEIETKNNNSFARVVNALNKILKNPSSSKEAKKEANAKLEKFLSGQDSDLKVLGRKTYSASDVGKKLGVSSQKIGRLSEAHNLKTKEFGEWFKDKSKHSSKEVESFRYYENAIQVFKGLLSSKEMCKQEKMNV